jgi:hypothetical protein
MRLFVFIDGSFANNKDFSSQIRYVIILANKTSINKTSINKTSVNKTSANKTSNKTSVNKTSMNETSTRANRFAIKGGIDLAIAINIIIKIITEQLGSSHTLIIVCTNSYLLHKCLVKLSTTKEKCLRINIMAFY